MDEFRAILDELGWSKAEFARRTGYHPKTISNWKRPPRIAEVYLNMVLDMDRIVRCGSVSGMPDDF